MLRNYITLHCCKSKYIHWSQQAVVCSNILKNDTDPCAFFFQNIKPLQNDLNDKALMTSGKQVFQDSLLCI